MDDIARNILKRSISDMYDIQNELQYEEENIQIVDEIMVNGVAMMYQYRMNKIMMNNNKNKPVNKKQGVR